MENTDTKHAGPVFYGETDFITHVIEGGYQIVELLHDVAVEARKIHINGRGILAEITCYYQSDKPFKDNILFNLQDYKERIKLAESLAGDCPELVPWLNILNHFCTEVINRYREINESEDISSPPQYLHIDSIIQGIEIPLNLPTTIYSPGGKGKSILADFIAVIYEYGHAPNLPFTPNQGHVLYCDWESSADVHRIYINAIKKGLGITEEKRIEYMFLDRPVFSLVDSLKTFVKENNIELVIIDSQMAAAAGHGQGLSEAEITSEYYNCLNSLNCTTLTIDHVNKASMQSQDGTGSPYGSVVKYNRARSIYELRAQQEIESDHLEFALIHQKYNLGKKQKPLGIAIDFTNETGELHRIDFNTCDIADNPVLSRALPNKTKILNYLLSEGLKTTGEISEGIEVSRDIVRAELSRNKKMFVKNGELWGVLERNITP